MPDSAPGVPSMRWFALHTRARSEARVEERLRARGLEAWAARAEVARQWSDRVKRVAEPLFPGYVFARLEAATAAAGTPSARDALLRALSTPGVADVVRHRGRPAPVRDDEMQAVRRLVAGVNETGTLPEVVHELEAGDPVQVVKGPFKGLEGTLVEARGGAQVVVRFGTLRLARAVRLGRGVVVSVAAH